MNNVLGIYFVKRKVFSLSALFFYTFLLLFQLGCKKPEDTIGAEVQPEEDQLDVAVVDTTFLLTYTEIEDSLRTDELSINLLGSYLDPLLGKYTAGFYTHLVLPTSNVNFGAIEDLVVDSVVLSLRYRGEDDFYGALDAQVVEVYEVSEDFSIDSAYFSNDELQLEPQDLVFEAGASVVPDPVEEVVVNGDTLPAQMRIRLNNELGERFINESGSANLVDNTAFVSFFKGLHVTVNNPAQMEGEGGILSFNLLSESSKVTIYYRDTAGADTTLTFDFLIDNNSARFNAFDHNYMGTEVEDQTNDSSLGQLKTFVQTGAGLKTVVRFPNLLNYLDSGINAINKAVLVIPVLDGTTDSYAPNERLSVRWINDEGVTTTIPDDWFEQHLGGEYDEDNNEYRFILTRYVQDLLNEDISDNGGLRIISTASAVTANRVVLNGGEGMDQARLIISYTKY